MSLQNFIDRWQLTNITPLTTTYMAELYRADYRGQQTVLKIYNEHGLRDEASGSAALRFWNGNGAVGILEQDSVATLLEYLDGGDLTSFIPDRDDEALQIFAETIKTLQADRPVLPPPGLVPLQSRYSHFIFKTGAKARPILKHAVTIIKSLLADMRNPCVLHGDLFHDNIINSAQGWKVIDPKGLWGERTMEPCAALLGGSAHTDFFASKENFRHRAKFMSDALSLDFDRLLNFVFVEACMIADWSEEVGHDKDAAHHFKMAYLIQSIFNET